MQRLLAFLVLSIIGILPVAGPLCSVTAHAASLPACCRASGKHKCALGSMNTAPAQLGIRSVCDQYSKVPQPSLAVANASSFLPAQGAATHDATIARFDVHCENHPPFHYCLERSHRKRGPPALLS